MHGIFERYQQYNLNAFLHGYYANILRPDNTTEEKGKSKSKGQTDQLMDH